MSQNPGPPLDSVPKTGLKKRKLNRNYVPPTSSESNTNNTANSVQSQPVAVNNPPREQQQTNSQQQISSQQQLIQQPQTPLAQNVSSNSSQAASSTLQSQTGINKNENDNSSNQPQQEQPSPSPVSSEFGVLKKRKIRIKLSPDSSSDQTVIQPSAAPIQTNEIPNIDIMSESSNENYHNSSGSRLGLDIEQDNTLSGRYMNPNFDLSKIGKNESKQLLNKSISKEYAERFTKDMTAREEQFRKDYVKPKEKADELLVNSAFLETELNSMIESISKNVQSSTAEFDLNKCNFNDISVTSGTSFKPNLSGLAKSYTMNSKEAIDALSGKHELLSIDELKTELEANFLETKEESSESNEDFIKQIKILFDQSNKQVSPTEFLIDLSMQDSVNLICKIALFFSAGLKCHPSVLFDRLYSQMNEDSRGRANIVSLQSALIQTKSSITDITGSFKYAIFYVLHLIKLAQCSALLRYMSGLLTFKKKNYYADALILDSDLCNTLSEEIEKIECVQIQGGLVSVNIPNLVPAVSGDRFALRVAGIVDSYLKKTRNWLLQGVEINSERILPLTDVLKIFVKSFLLQKSGSCLSLDALYDIFEGIAGLSAQENNSNQQNDARPSSMDPCCNHPAYKRFVEIFKGKEVTKYWDTKSRIWVTIVTALNEKILPYIILFGVSIPQTKTTMNPAYFRDPIACLRIAHALLPMKFPAFNVRYESIKRDVSSLD